jgi:hypothetical protein
MPKSIALIALAAAALIAAGCGDDDESDALTKQQYIAKAGASCEKSGKQAGEAFERIIGDRQPTPELAQRFVAEGVVPPFRSGLEEREALAAPEGDEDQIEAINAAGREALAGFEEIAGDQASSASLMRGQIPDPATKVDALNRRYGVQKCGGDQ